MKTPDRKAIIAEYKERKRNAGVYAVRCPSRGEIWVGSAPDLATIQNRLWFGLRHGGQSNPALKSAWAAAGEEGISFEILEHIADDDDPHIRGKLLIARAVHWRTALAAMPI